MQFSRLPFTQRSRMSMLVCLGILAVAAAGCSVADRERPLTVFAAASTIDAMTEVLTEFEKVRGVKVKTSYGSSSSLAAMILQGIEVDLFLSANGEWADKVGVQLRNRGIDCGSRDFLSNRLVVVVHEDHRRSPLTRGELKSLRDLPAAGFGKIAVADTEGVPAGMYAKQALQNAGVWEEIADSLVTTADVRGALALVELGAAEAAIVYATDAAAGGRVRVELQIPESEQPEIRYRLVDVGHPSSRTGNRLLLEFLLSDSVADVFERHGFEPLFRGTD